MKKLLLPVLFIASLIYSNKTQAQTLIIGAGAQSGTASNGATGDPGPTYRSSATSNFVYARYHYLYTQAELAGLPTGAIITEVAWYKDNNAASNAPYTFQVYMKNSALTAVPAPTQAWATLITGSTPVYNSTTTNLPATIGWIPYTLTAPYTYTGSGLEISVNFDMSAGSSPWTTAGVSWQKDPINNRTISYCGSTASTNLGNARTVRPRLRITYVPGTPCTSPPTPGTVTLSPNTSVCSGSPIALNITGNSFGQGQSYQWQSGPSATGPFTNLGSSSTLTATNVNPTATIYYRMGVTCGTSTTYTPAAQVVVNPTMAAGNYTIDGTQPTAGTNFHSFSDAVNAMSCGINGPVNFTVANGSYNEQIIIPSIAGSSATNRITFKSASGNANSVNVNFTATGTGDNYIFRYNDASNISFRNISFIANGGAFCRNVELNGTSSRDSFINCVFKGPAVTAASINTALVYSDVLTGSNNVFTGNKFINGSYGNFYSGTSTTVLTDNPVFVENEYVDQFSYGAYFYYTTNLKFNNNKISSSSPNTFYGMYTYYGDGAIEIRDNNITGIPTGYGIYQYYNDATATGKGLIANNVINIGSGANAATGIRSNYCNYQRFYNNSVNIRATDPDCYAGYFYYSSTTYQNNEIKNNVFSNSGGGYALYNYNPTSTYNNSWDYNNLYTTGPKLVQRGTPAATFNTLPDWRAAATQELNSISYDPGFVSQSDLHPDASNPASWSLNGRGVHIAGNTTDHDNNPRIVALADGVPDIGAYEFVPQTTPPLAVATPAIPVPGTQQVFTFGYDTVAVINWKANSVVPNTIDVRQYTGSHPPLFTLPGFMYFYTDINTQAMTYNYDVSVYYKDPWQGTIAAENSIRLLKKLGSNQWHAYNGSESAPSTARNYIYANSLTNTGLYTGVEDGKVPSATVKPATTTVMCPGGSLILHANATGPGYTYQWQLNGVDIPGATGPSYTALAMGDYTVDITDNANNITIASDPVSITIIAPPAAQATASGALTYCIGNQLTLNTPPAPGLTYQWYLNGNLIPGATNTAYPVNAAGNYTVMVKNIACSSLSPVLTVAAGPLSVSLGGDTTFCEEKGKVLQLDAGHTGAQYIWSTGATNQQITAGTTGKYWVKVDAGPGCVATDTILVHVDPLPKVNSISYSRNGNTYNFSPGGETDVMSYLWLFNDGASSTDKNAQHTFTVGATEVKLVVFNSCGTDTILLKLPLAVKDVASGTAALNIYPNPATDKLTVNSEGDFFIKDIAVLNEVGQMIYRETLQDRVKTQVVDVANLPVGHYMMRANTTDGTITKPFNVMR